MIFCKGNFCKGDFYKSPPCKKSINNNRRVVYHVARSEEILDIASMEVSVFNLLRFMDMSEHDFVYAYCSSTELSSVLLSAAVPYIGNGG